MSPQGRLSSLALSITVALHLLTFALIWHLVNTFAVLLLGLTLSLVIAPAVRNNLIARLILALLYLILALYVSFVKVGFPIEAVSMTIGIIAWFCYFQDDWPNWKRRLTNMATKVQKRFSRPVMPVPET